MPSIFLMAPNSRLGSRYGSEIVKTYGNVISVVDDTSEKHSIYGVPRWNSDAFKERASDYEGAIAIDLSISERGKAWVAGLCDLVGVRCLSFRQALREFGELPSCTFEQISDYTDFIVSKSVRGTGGNFVPLETVPQNELDKIDIKTIAFYLPQFHAFPLNDEWFGKGFTEWTNVTKAIPQYTGHYQPQLPIDVGYYDLNNISVVHRQVEIAKIFGIYGFCFHYYWFSGSRLMEMPIFQWLSNQDIDFPFCLNWANENWGKLWDGGDREVRYKQELLPDDDEKFFDDILPFFNDKRYIKINEKPVLSIYRPHLFKKERFLQFIDTLRRKSVENGFPGLYLISVNSHGFQDDPRQWGMDAMLEFPPHSMKERGVNEKSLNVFINPNFCGEVWDGENYVAEKKYLYDVRYKLFKGVAPSWDNTPRKAYSGSIVLDGITPEVYKEWLSGCIEYTRKNHSRDESLIFVNAWNEWAEGAHLEPDSHYGYAYLQATRDALLKGKK
ncbi:glycoside hydrolase family 99-like domain-containing protein [Comamonas sp. Y6]|uniref:Glycoside hydrolase family 99-like domain-containing protein n=1 Tax=Comamonas resistens TaxID=3046670 RepID=A0ABY8SSH2_9BURK|nr:glycoside hydrolase family 99-like domain-containing protein [Comamonas resistens]MDL5039211.1 glycoside hydrolase family 99-like domain-containing protein [Comamonas resistens]WHS66010.1 glycoside hydrolase family 99-like domain-containing protein [Comamonas resistens]